MKWKESLDQELPRRGLNILDAMVQRMEDGQRIEIADATTVLRLLRLLGEEDRRIMAENAAEEWAIVTGLEDALRAKRAMEFVRESRRLSLMLRNRFTEDASVRAGAMESAKDQTPHEVHAGLSRLEQKYFRRARESASHG